jgi:hypothetical protein
MYRDERLVFGALGQQADANLRPFLRNLKADIKSGAATPQSAVSELRARGDVTDWKANRIEKAARKLARQKTRAIKPGRYRSLDPLIESGYETLLGRAPTFDEIESFKGLAGARRISPSDPGAFSAFLSDTLMASPEGMGKIKTEQDYLFEAMYGPMGRDEEGYLKRGTFTFNPANVTALKAAMGS